MLPIRRMFNEVQYELVKIILLNVFLSTVILFLIADLIALIFSMPIWYVLVLSLVYFVVIMIHEIRQISMAKVEERNPELKEMLRTAKDNMDDDSLMAHALFYEVIGKMKHVSSGTFLDFKKLMAKLSVIFALSIVLVSISFFNINVSKFDNPLAGPLDRLSGVFGGGTAGVDTGSADIGGVDDDIFGESSMAVLGDDRLQATINPSLDDPDFNDVDPASPSGDPLADLGGGDAGFRSGSSYEQEGLDERDLERSYEYAKQTQE